MDMSEEMKNPDQENQSYLDATTVDWYRKAFGSLYYLFDQRRQAREGFAKIRQHETNFLLGCLESIEGEEPPLVIDLGIGYGRVARKLLEAHKSLRIVGVDLSRPLTDKILEGLPDSQRNRLDIVYMDLRDVGTLPYRNKADLVIMMFTTFGCFENDDENASTLKEAYNLLKPGGMLVIEQYNPEKNRQDKIDLYVDEAEQPNTRRKFRLIKTSSYVKQSKYCHYSGHYLYFDTTNQHCSLIQCDSYSLRLYTPEWFKEMTDIFPDQPEVNVYGGFGENDRLYNPKNSELMIVCIEKPIF